LPTTVNKKRFETDGVILAYFMTHVFASYWMLRGVSQGGAGKGSDKIVVRAVALVDGGAGS
jgi:hypothetical protein